MNSTRAHSFIGTGIALALLVFAFGCSGESSSSSRRPFNPTGRDLNTPAGVSYPTATTALIQPFGSLPYAGLNLPLVSPDGRFVVTETGVAPRWETVLAMESASVPEATSLEIYELVYEPGTINNPPLLRTAVSTAVVLGRACDDNGFLVEAPQTNGSRWIGKVDWRTGDISWLIKDEYVNAFATLGPGGKLAWCRRAVDAERFDLVVRHTGGEEWTLQTEGDDWLMPMWSGVGDNLGVIHVSNRVLSLVYLNASSRAAALQSMIRRVPLANNGSVVMAYQMTTAYPTTVLPNVPMRDELLFHHPVYNRVAIWRPLSGQANDITLLHPESFAAVTLGTTTAMVSTPGELKQQSLTNRALDARLLIGNCVVRRTANPTWPFVVLRLAESTPNLITVTYMKLMTPGS